MAVADDQRLPAQCPALKASGEDGRMHTLVQGRSESLGTFHRARLRGLSHLIQQAMYGGQHGLCIVRKRFLLEDAQRFRVVELKRDRIVGLASAGVPLVRQAKIPQLCLHHRAGLRSWRDYRSMS